MGKKKKKLSHRQEFLQIFRELAYIRNEYMVWSDFVTMSAISIAINVPVEESIARNRQFLDLEKKYTEEEREQMIKLFSIVMRALLENPKQDFLGDLFHALNLHNEKIGQYLTPYPVCHFISSGIRYDVEYEKEKDKKGYILVDDNACGSGAMLIAASNVAAAQGVNSQEQILFYAQDIDRVAAMMCYIQLSLLRCSAVVVGGDSLAKPGFSEGNDIWFTPTFAANVCKFKYFFEHEMKNIQNN